MYQAPLLLFFSVQILLLPFQILQTYLGDCSEKVHCQVQVIPESYMLIFMLDLHRIQRL